MQDGTNKVNTVKIKEICYMSWPPNFDPYREFAAPRPGEGNLTNIIQVRRNVNIRNNHLLGGEGMSWINPLERVVIVRITPSALIPITMTMGCDFECGLPSRGLATLGLLRRVDRPRVPTV
jgi:hypothetical protein